MNDLITSSDITAKGQHNASDRFVAFFKLHQKFFIFITILMCLIGVCLISFLVLMNNSLRLDESQSLWQTSHSIGGTLRAVAQDVHVPLYHLMLHFWQLYFGHSVPTIRLLSLIFFLINIPLFYVLARHILNVGWSLFATIVFSFSPFMNWYANEARMYSLLALMATLSQIYYLRIMQNKKRAWKGFTITALFGAYTHYFFSFNLAAQGLFFLTNRKKFAPGSFRRFIIVGIMVAIALAPWLIYFHSLGSGKNTSPKLARPSTVDFFNAFSQFLFGFQDNYINTILVSCWPLVILVAFLAIRRGQKVTPEVSYMVTAAFLPVLMAYILSFVVSPFYLSRYMISCVAPLIIVLVWLISHYGKRMTTAIVCLVVAIMIATSIQQADSLATPVKENYRGVAQTIESEAQPQDVVALSAPFTVYPFEYYYNGRAQVVTLPEWDRQAAGAIPAFNKSTLPAQVKQISANHHYLYLVLSQDQGYENTVKQYFLHHYPQKYMHVYSPDLTLYVFQVGYNQVPPLGSAQTIIKAPKVTASTLAKADLTSQNR
jgi:mannosyltransferase